MSTRRVRLGLFAAITLLFTPFAAAQNALLLESASVPVGGSGTMRALMDHDFAVTAYTLAIAFDSSEVEILGVDLGGTVSESVGAEGFFSQTFGSGGIIVGVFLDQDPPFDGQTIPIGTAQHVLNIDVAPLPSLPAGTPSSLDFQDDTFGSPPVDNQLLGAAMTVGVPEGLVLTSGTITPTAGSSLLYLQDGVEIPAGGMAPVTLFLDNDLSDVTAFTATVDHTSAVELLSISIVGTDVDAVGAEFVQDDIGASGGTIAVIFDQLPPFDGQALAPGTALSLATFSYECPDPGFEPAPPATATLSISSPTLELVATSITPATQGTTITGQPFPPIPSSIALGTTAGPSETITAAPGETLELGVYVTHPTLEVQGVQMAMVFDCAITLVEEFDITGTPLDGVAEFVIYSSDLDPDDGDGCEYTAGILLDALPPFAGQVLPPTTGAVLIGTIPLLVPTDAVPGTAATIEFVDFIDGTGGALVENILVTDFASLPIGERTGTTLEVVDAVPFLRGDCNIDGAREISDVIALFSIVFEGATTTCLSACDFGDDGTLDLADGVALAEYLFTDGPAPAAPAVECGAPSSAFCDAYGACE